MINDEQNFYEILELSEDATLQEIERAYNEAKETYNPASSALYSMFSDEEVQDLNKLIEKAYNVLSNQDLRLDYDSQRVENKNSGKNTEDFIYTEPQGGVEKKTIVRNDLIIKDFPKDALIEEQIKNLTDCSGAFLQKVRKYKSISLDEISMFSKISKTNILAVEEEDFENLPVKVFIRGFVVQICKLLGIDPIPFSKEYLKSFDEFQKQ